MPGNFRMFAMILLTAMTLAAPSVGAQGWLGSWGGGGAPDVQYVMDSNGNYTGEKNTIYGDHTDGNRYACRPSAGGSTCSSCGNCHTSTQVQSKTYVARFDGARHATLHFPKLVARLAPGQRLPWGPNSMVTNRDKRIVVTSMDRVPRDLVYFPAGSVVLLNPRGQASFVVLPPNTEPRKAVSR